MKALLSVFTAAILLAIFTSLQPANKWENLLDRKMSKWDTYLSFKHTDGDKGEIPKDAAGHNISPVGYNKDTAHVFFIVMEGGEPVLRISGEIYGCVFTKQDFGNYHLRLKVRWGDKKYVPRLHDYKDSGVLYNSQGEAGVDYWHSWMLAQEFQVGEGTTGDRWAIAAAHADIRATKRPDTTTYIFNPKGELRDLGGYCQASGVFESKGEHAWTQLDLICYEGKSLHIVNGHVIMALQNSRYKIGDEFRPLTHGKIQLQSEAAEVFYKDIQIRHIDDVPTAYRSYFN